VLRRFRLLRAGMARMIELMMYPALGSGAIRSMMNQIQGWTGACCALPGFRSFHSINGVWTTEDLWRSTGALETRSGNQQSFQREIVLSRGLFGCSAEHFSLVVPSSALVRLSPRLSSLGLCHQQRRSHSTLNGSANGSRARSEYAHRAAPLTNHLRSLTTT